VAPALPIERIALYASLAGRENIIAGCGFGTDAISTAVHPSIAWRKLAAMAEGAKLASKELWA
jgi:5-methyltetrahydropteroyltriglutamate--homocysteine methyltransferase